MNYRTQVIIPVLASLGWRWHGEKNVFLCLDVLVHRDL